MKLGWSLGLGALPLVLLVALLVSPVGVVSSVGPHAHAGLPSASSSSASVDGRLPSSCWTAPVAVAGCFAAQRNSPTTLPSAPADVAARQIPTASTYWQLICDTGSCGPGDRESPMIAYDPVDGYLVLFGGLNGSTSTVLGDTWTYSYGSNSWTQIFPTTAPPARFDGQLTWDAADGYLVLFSGCASLTGCPPGLTDTWSFVGGQWTQLFPSTNPTGRFFFGMSYDTADGYVLLFGGDDGSFLSDTWTFVGGQWTELFPSTSPPARLDFGMSDDPTDGQVVLFGGYTSAGEVGDTWTYVGGVWTQQFPTTAPAMRGLQNHQMDTDNGYPFIWGGYDLNTGACFSDTWTWAAGQWTQLAPSVSPPAKGWGALNYYGGVGTVDYGGYNCAVPGDVGDTWLYVSGPHVTTPVPTPLPPVEAGTRVTFQSTVSDPGTAPDTFYWTWGPNRSMQCAPSTSLFLNCTPLRAGTYFVYAHITDSIGRTSFTASAPYVVIAGPMVSTPIPDVVSADVGQRIIFNSTLIAGGTPPDSYGWAASAPGLGCPISAALTITCVPTAPGTYNITVSVTDSVGGAGWNTSRAVLVYPLPVSGVPIPSPGRSIDVGQTATFTANVTGVGSGGDTFSWSVAPAVGLNCPASFSAKVTCLGATAGWYNVTLTITDSNGGQGSAALPFPVFADPSPGTPAASLASIDVGQNVSFSSALGSGGSGGLAYDWSSSSVGFGCGSNTQTNYRCAPSASGTYLVSLTVTDSNGGRGSTVSAPYVVHHLPEVSAPVPAVPSPQVGESVDFRSSLLDPGSGGDVYTWSTSSPASLSCTASGGLVASCTAASAGSYTVTIEVADSNGGVSRAVSVLVVVSAALQASASATPSTGTASLTVTFSSSAWGGSAPYTYSWRFGDGSGEASSLPNPTHTYTSGGTFVAVLFVNDSSGHSVSQQVTVTVSSAAAPTLLSSVPGGAPTLGLFLLLAILVAFAFVLLLRRRKHLEAGAPTMG